jgi:hypothetical protein
MRHYEVTLTYYPSPEDSNAEVPTTKLLVIVISHDSLIRLMSAKGAGLRRGNPGRTASLMRRMLREFVCALAF